MVLRSSKEILCSCCAALQGVFSHVPFAVDIFGREDVFTYLIDAIPTYFQEEVVLHQLLNLLNLFLFSSENKAKLAQLEMRKHLLFVLTSIDSKKYLSDDVIAIVEMLISSLQL